MLSNWFMNFIARIVLISYTTQLLAPIAHASEGEVLTMSGMDEQHSQVRVPSPSMEKLLQASLQSFLKSQVDHHKSEPQKPFSSWKDLATTSDHERAQAPELIERPLKIKAAGRTETSEPSERPELLGDVRSVVMNIFERLTQENAVLKSQLKQISGISDITPYLSSHLSPPSLGPVPWETGGDYVHTIFAELRKTLFGIISRWYQENDVLKQLIRYEEAAKRQPKQNTLTSIFKPAPSKPATKESTLIPKTLAPLSTPTLSFRIEQLNDKAPSFRLSIDQSRFAAGATSQIDYQWSYIYTLSSLGTSYTLAHPWMQYLKLQLLGDGQLTVESLKQFSGDFDTSGYFQCYNYVFSNIANLHLKDVFTEGLIVIRKGDVVSAEGTIQGKQGISINAHRQIVTRAKDPNKPTLLTSDKKVGLVTSFLDNENSFIRAQIIQGTLGRKRQEGLSLNNSHGAIRADELLDLYTHTRILNTDGVLESLLGKVQITGAGPLENERGQIKGYQQLDLCLDGTIQNQGGFLWSQGSTNVQADSLTNRDEAKVSGKDLTIQVKKELKTDQLSQLSADQQIKVTAGTLYQESPFLAPDVSVHTIQDLTLTSSQFAQSLALSTEHGNLLYKPNELQASRLLSLSSICVPLDLKTPIKTPGSLSIRAPKVTNRTSLVAKEDVKLTATSESASYPVQNFGDIVSTTKGLTINAKGFAHRRGRLQVNESAQLPRCVMLKARTNIGGNLSLVDLDERSDLKTLINFKSLDVGGLLHITLNECRTMFDFPISITGHLEVARAGPIARPITVVENLFAQKGVKINIPQAPVIIGMDDAQKPPVKLQASEGSIEIKSKSLDIPKAQLFARTGMQWEVQEKKIHIGRGNVSNVSFMSIFENPNIRDLYENSGMKIFLSSDLGQRDFPYALVPFKNSNGTMVVTEGFFKTISPEGVFIDQAEIQVLNGKDWNITAQKPIRNEGGKIDIQGNLTIHNPKRLLDSKAIFQNVMLSQTAYINTGSFLVPYIASYPFCNRPELTVGRALSADELENTGGLFYIAHQLSCTVKSSNILMSLILANQRLTRYLQHVKGCFPCYLTFTGNMSSPKSIISRSKTDLQLEGLIQSPIIVFEFAGKAVVGQLANYRRPTIPVFQQMQHFLDVSRPTAIYQSVMDSPKPWINQPTVPLTWKTELPPAVGLGPNGLFLLGNDDKLLFHPLQEIDMLPRVFNMQLRRGYLDAENSETQVTYIMGRLKAYELYQKFFVPKAIESQSHSPVSAPEQALSTVNHTLVQRLSEEERQQLKFMMLYYPMSYENRTVYLPTSWLSKQYDDAKVRNPDGGVFGNIVIFKGKPDRSLIHCVSQIHGDTLLGIDVTDVVLERQSYRWLEHRVNSTHKKGSWFRGDSDHSEVVTIACSEAQQNTGLLSTGTHGQMAVKGNLNLKNGSQVIVGERGIACDIPELTSSPSVDVQAVQHSSSAGRMSITHHTPVYHIQPAGIISQGPVQGSIDIMTLESTHVVSEKKDIDLKVKSDAMLLACQRSQSSGLHISEQDDATVLQEVIQQIAVPCAFLAPNGRVSLTVGGKLYGVAPQFVGKVINLDAKEHDIFSLLMANQVTTTTTTEETFSSQTTTSMQESLSHIRTLMEGDEIHIKGEKASILGALIKGGILYDHTKEGIMLGSKVIPLKNRTETNISQPLSETNFGTEGWQEVMVPTTLALDKVVRVLQGPMKFESVDWDKNKTQVIGDLIETTYQLKSWQTSWAYHEQLIPDEALVVVALGIAIATQGMGVQALGPLLKGITAATGMQLSAAGIAMVNAGFTAVLTQLATPILASGDPLQGVKGLTSNQGLQTIAVSMISAGLCQHVGAALKVEMNPGQKFFVEHLKEQILRATVDATLDVAIGEMPVNEALQNALKQIPIKTVAAYVANQISTLYKDKKINYGEQKGAHFVLGAVGGFAQDPTFNGAASGAVGALTAEIIGEAIISNSHAIATEALENIHDEGKLPTKENIEKATKKVLQHKADIAKVAAGSIAALTGQNASVAIFTATNAVDNNLILAALPFILPEVYAILATTSLGIATIWAHQETTKLLQEWDAFLNERGEKNQSEAVQKGSHSSSGTSGATPPEDREPDEDHEQYKKVLRREMERPHTENPKLTKKMREFYKPEGTVGNGSTAAAARHERLTGELVKNKDHITKSERGIKWFERWLAKNPTAKSGDRAAAENVIKDLKDALGKE